MINLYNTQIESLSVHEIGNKSRKRKEIEIWKDIEGFEGNYQVSSKQRIKSVKRKIEMPNGFFRTVFERIMKQYESRGYLKVNLRFDNKQNLLLVHRLFAKAFIPNPNNLPYLNHINGIKTDNRIENLEWCSHLDNMRHAFKTKLIPSGEDNHNSKLSNNKVLVIKRLMLMNPNFNQSAVARKLGVQRSIINGIVKKRKWNYV